MGIELGGFYAQTCFMAQQSAEKALKALLYLRGMRLIREDSISELLTRVTDVYPGLNRYQEIASRFDRYHSVSRYLGVLPGSVPYEEISGGQAQEAVGDGENLVLEVRNIIRLAR
jgi:HEPN domain-containing protein